jgi:N-lysine methyltransferase SETD6
MFWSSEDLEQLKGSTLFGRSVHRRYSSLQSVISFWYLDKIGKEQAENDYAAKVVPLLKVRRPLSVLVQAKLTFFGGLKSRTDLFGSEYPNPNFSLQAYHIMGSRILSRSFHVDTDVEEMSVAEEEEEPSSSVASNLSPRRSNSEEIEDDEDTDDDNDDPGNVAMVPIADMLNARYGCENVRPSVPIENVNGNCSSQAKLFYEQDHLQMVTTRFIPRGEQIVRSHFSLGFLNFETTNNENIVEHIW